MVNRCPIQTKNAPKFEVTLSQLVEEFSSRLKSTFSPLQRMILARDIFQNHSSNQLT